MNKYFKKNAVVIFAKKPEVGKVKTRIAEETSAEFACEFAKACFSDLLNKIRNSDYYELLVVTDSLGDLQWFQGKYSLNGIALDQYGFKDGKNKRSQQFKKIFSMLLGGREYGF